MTSRRPEWISVGNLGDRKAQWVYCLQGVEQQAELSQADTVPFLRPIRHIPHTTCSLPSQWGSGGVGPPLHTPGLSANRGSTLSQTGHYLVGEAGTCLPHPLQRVLPPPAVSGCQYSQGLDVLRHHRGVLWVSLWGDQVPSLSRLPPQMAWKKGLRLQITPHMEGVSHPS